MGFGEVVKYEQSTTYDYGLQSNQDIRRFGNHFYVNSSGMRSDEVSKSSITILKFGDSVLNGGLRTDQSQLASTLLEENIRKNSVDARVYNVSAGSWGPDNAFAWMEQHGDFGADVIVLVFSSHDWTDHRNCRNVVGNVPFYPKKDPLFALTDVFSWVSSRYLKDANWDEIPLIPNCTPNKGEQNSGWHDFENYSKREGIKLLIYHHPTLEEFQNAQYDENGQKLNRWLRTSNIHWVSGLESSYTKDMYRDQIHLDSRGQLAIEKAIRPKILELISDGS